MNQYREGKVKSTPVRGVKETLKPCAYKRSEQRLAVTACLLHNEPTSCRRAARLSAREARTRSESESEEGDESPAADAKPSDLHMTRVKFR